jgi:DNA-binding NarL/FixJ family response regulator
MTRSRIIDGLLLGLSNAEIAAQAGVSLDTTKKIISELYRVYGIVGGGSKRVKLMIIMRGMRASD